MKMQILSQLHSNYMGIEKTWLLAHESIYWVKMNADIQNTEKHCLTCLEYQNMQPQEKMECNEVLAKPWKVVCADISLINNSNLFCMLDYYSKFLVVKKADSMLAEDLIHATKIVFTELDLPKKFVSDAGKNFVSK